MPALEGCDIVCVGFADWDAEIWTNQQHLMSRLAASNRILFVESLGLRKPTLSGRDIGRIGRRLRRGIGGSRALDGLNVLSPLVLPLHGSSVVRAVNRKLLRGLVGREVRRLGFRSPILWSYVPQAEVLIDALEPSIVVYHVVDDIAAHERIDAESFGAAEARFVRRADLVIASSQPLVTRLKGIGSDVHYAPNVADTVLFSRALEDGPVDGALDRLPRPRAVFTGAIAGSKLDLPLIRELARLRPNWAIALVGPVGLGDPLTDVSSVGAEPNVHLLGARAHDALPAVLRGADVGLIPYARNRLTASVFPMKVYEYLAAGVPVLATHLPALDGLADVTVVSDAAEAALALDDLLARESPERRAARSQRAAPHSWEARIAALREAVAAVA